jgi:two-component system response regulator DegU
MSLFSKKEQKRSQRGRKTVRVLLADNHPDVRSALHLLLEEKGGVNVIGEVGTSYDLLWQLNSLRPDLILLDWELPGTRAAELVKILRGLYPELKVFVLSSHPNFRQDSLQAGACDFICKSEPPEQLMRALELLEV